MRFLLLFSYFSGPILNGEEGSIFVIFKEIKKEFRSPQTEAQIWTEPKYILHFLKDPAGHTRHNRTTENSLVQQPRFFRGNAALAADLWQSFGR